MAEDSGNSPETHGPDANDLDAHGAGGPGTANPGTGEPGADEPGTGNAASEGNAGAIFDEEHLAHRRMIRARWTWLITVAVVTVAAVAITAIQREESAPVAHPVVTLAPASTVQAVAGIPAAALQTVGTGSISRGLTPLRGLPYMESGGLPVIRYVTNEACPYCAAESWVVVAALSQFGSFHDLGLSESANKEVFANVPAFTFYGATYSSRYLIFRAAETTSNEPGKSGSFLPLERLGTADQAMVSLLDGARATTAGALPGTAPVLDVANRFYEIGAPFSPALLANQSMAAVATALTQPASPIAQAVDGAANWLAAAICSTDGFAPARTCDPVTQLSGR